MEKVKFNVSSKTARLIGRENISDVVFFNVSRI